MKITEIITRINEMIVEISENVVKVLHPPTVANRSNNATLLVIVKRLDVIIRPRSISSECYYFVTSIKGEKDSNENPKNPR